MCITVKFGHPFIPGAAGSVGFTAAMTTVDTNVGGGSTVIWESIITNVGGGYQPTTGEFTCPQDGLYYFAVSVTTNDGDDLRAYLQLMHNGNVVVTTLAISSPKFGSSTVSAVIECTNGQKVWVRCIQIYSCNLIGYAGEKYTSFSGVKIN